MWEGISKASVGQGQTSARVTYGGGECVGVLCDCASFVLTAFAPFLLSVTCGCLFTPHFPCT